MRKVIGFIATLDTKGPEAEYVKGEIEKRGMSVLLIDSGTRGVPHVKGDVTREEIAAAAGTTVDAIAGLGRGEANVKSQVGLRKIVKGLYESGKMQGVLAIGGGDGALLATAAMRELPLGVPKMLVTPIAQGQERFGPYVGKSDITIMHSVIDILGVNRISKKIFDLAVGAICGMVDVDLSFAKPTAKAVAVTMYGNTTPAVMVAKGLLERRGIEVVTFHPNGTGGKAMEDLVEDGMFDGVLDMTTHEITDHLFKGHHAGEADRLTAAGRKGVPQLVVPGCVDFILGGPMDTLPPEYQARKTYFFNPAVTLVRTTREEIVTVANVMAGKLNQATGPTTLMIPLKGFSMYAVPGGKMYDPEGDRAFIDAVTRGIDPGKADVVTVDAHINDPVFATRAVEKLVEMMS